MSIGVVCNLSDGVVLGVDSALTISGSVRIPTGETTTGVLNVYNECEKLFHLADLNAGVMFTGLGMLGARTLESYVREWETTQLSVSDDPAFREVGSLTESLNSFFAGIYHSTVVPAVRRKQANPSTNWRRLDSRSCKSPSQASLPKRICRRSGRSQSPTGK